jgi:magnesium transporter
MAADLDHSLSMAFMRGHPAQAARVLETLAPEDAAALFDRVPARLGAAVLTAMLPPRAARCLGGLDDARALELLSPMGTQPTVAVLRHLPEARRKTLIAGLPTAAALASTLLIGYTDDTLGAWADPDIVTLPAETRSEDALHRLQQAPAKHATLFITQSERRLVGQVGLATLMQAPAAATLATLMQRPPAVLLAHAPLAGTLSHPGWNEASLLPVLEPGERLVGALSHDALLRALQRSAPAAPPPERQAALPAVFARGYWQALTGLIQSSLTLLPRVPALKEEPHERR